jgi:hypothetical protein
MLKNIAPVSTPTSGGTLTTGDTVASSTAENTIYTLLEIPASTLQVGDEIEIEGFGYLSSKGTGPGNLTIKAKAGSVVLLTTGAMALPAGLANAGFWLRGRLRVCAVGATGKMAAQGWFQFENASNVPFCKAMVNTGTGTSGQKTVDMTAAFTINITVQFSVSDSNNTITFAVTYIGPPRGMPN